MPRGKGPKKKRKQTVKMKNILSRRGGKSASVFPAGGKFKLTRTSKGTVGKKSRKHGR